MTNDQPCPTCDAGDPTSIIIECECPPRNPDRCSGCNQPVGHADDHETTGCPRRTDETYNGWKNRETWAAALHLSNDEWLYRTVSRIVANADAEAREFTGALTGALAADRIESFVSESVDEVLHVTPGEEWARMMIADVGSFWRVDWFAVADAFRDES